MRNARLSLALVLSGLLVAAAPAAETKIGPKGQVYVNGKAVIPLGVWSQPTYLFEYHKHLGMNCIIGVDEEKRDFRDAKDGLEAGAANNLGLLISPRRDPTVPDHPAVWGHLSGVMFPRDGVGRLRQSYEEIRRREPNHFVMVNIPIHNFLRGQDPNFFTQGVRYADAVISHVWPQCEDSNNPDLRNVGKFVDLVRKYCKDRPGGEVSIWPDINPHAWTLKKEEGGKFFTAPTPAELRFQIWLALIHGADGVCFFPISFEPMFVYAQIPAKNEQELAWNSRLIEKMTPALTADESPLKIEVTSDRKDGLLDWTTRTAGGKHYVFLLNGEKREQTVTLRAPELGTKWQVRDAIKEEAAAVNGGAVSEKLPGLALRIWELTPVGSAAVRP